ARRRSIPSNDSRVSVSVTRAPRRASSSAAAMPLLAAPTTTTRRPATVKLPTSSPQLQGGEAEERKDHRHDQEPRNDLRLAPSNQFEVMVNRRHLEDTL